MLKVKYSFNYMIICSILLFSVLFSTGCGNKSAIAHNTTAGSDKELVEEIPFVTDKDSAEENIDNSMDETQATIEQAEESSQKKEMFPMTLEDGKITIDSMFQYSGINLDYQDEFCEEIGALQITNTSNEYLEYADVSVTLTDGTVFNFHVQDIPAKQAVIAFELENKIYKKDHEVQEVILNASWMNEISSFSDVLEYSVDGTVITLTNISNSSLTNIHVKYHCYMDDVYLGGVSYEGIIEQLNAQESTAIDASECYLGEANVTNIIF